MKEDKDGEEKKMREEVEKDGMVEAAKKQEEGMDEER